MNNELARRLIDREDKSQDINPDGLSLEQIKALDISPEDWQLVYDIEVKSKNRPDVIAYVLEQTATVKKSNDEAAKKALTKQDDVVTAKKAETVEPVKRSTKQDDVTTTAKK